MNTPSHISKQTARRYVLGRQGLWPGRRWAGQEGAAAAIRQIDAVQVDPIQMLARSHDLVMHSRVADYRSEHLDQLLYQQRQFFDYGGTLFVYPMEQLPYWRLVMRRRGEVGRYPAWGQEHQAAIEEVRHALRERGPLGNRDFVGNVKLTNYRSGKDTGVALYYLWITGELMTHHRERFQRIFDFRDNVAPAQYNYAASDAEAESFIDRNSLSYLGLTTAQGWRNSVSSTFERTIKKEVWQPRVEQMLAAGEVATVTVEGRKEVCYYLAADREIMAMLAEGEMPKAWQPLDTTTEQEVNFLAPLDIVSARGRAKTLFDFDYIWEVYKPAHLRRWGYYTMPILYGDTLVARLDPKLERASQTLQILGFWLEDEAMADDLAFGDALARGLARFRDFHEAHDIDLSGIPQVKLREYVRGAIASLAAA